MNLRLLNRLKKQKAQYKIQFNPLKEYFLQNMEENKKNFIVQYFPTNDKIDIKGYAAQINEKIGPNDMKLHKDRIYLDKLTYAKAFLKLNSRNK